MVFFTEVDSQIVVSGELNNGREAGGRMQLRWMAGKGFMKKMSDKGEDYDYD